MIDSGEESKKENRKEAEKAGNLPERLSRPQKTLLTVLYGLIILMIVFSLLALRNLGEEGYNQCVQEKCEKKGEAFCQKPRELHNCCWGAGGELAASAEGKYICLFES